MKRIFVIAFSILSNVVFAQTPELIIPNGHAKHIDQIATTSDGKYIASVSYKTLIIWDLISHKKIHEINLNISEASSLSITDKLDKLVVTTKNGTFCYDLKTGKEIFTDGSATVGAAFSKDGSKVYVVNFGTLTIYDAFTGKEIKNISKAIKDVSKDCKFYELDNNRLLILHHLGWSILNLETEEIVFKKELGYGEDEQLLDFNYSKGDNAIVALTEKNLRSLNPTTGSVIKEKKLSFRPFGSCVTDNHEVVIFGNDFKATLYKTEVLSINDFSVIKTASQPQADVPEIIFYGNNCFQLPGTHTILYNNDKQLNFFNLNDGSFTNPFQNKVTDFKQFYYYSNLSQRLLPDNDLALTTEDNGIRSFNMESFKPDTYTPAPQSAVFSPDGKLVAGIGQKITLSSRINGKVIKTIPLPAGIDYEVEFFFFNYDNTKLIYTERSKGSIGAIDINTGLASRLVTFGSSYYECSASYDGKYFACIPFIVNANYLKVYNLQNKQTALQVKTGGVIKFLNDSYYLLAAKEKDSISIYKADDPAYISSFQLQHYNKFFVLGGDIKNNIIAIGEVGGFEVGTWNIKLITLEGKLLKEFTSANHHDFLKAAFSKDDKVMLTPNTQKGVQVWNTESGALFGTYYFIEKTNEYIFVSPEGLFDGSVAGMKELYFVKNNKPVPLEKLYEQFYTPDLLRRKISGEHFSPPDVANLHDAPKVSIAYASVQRNLEVADDLPTYLNTTGVADITITASANDDAVDEIRLFQNGKVVNLVTRNLIVEDQKSATAVKKYTINLLPGQNNLRAVALNTQRTESEPEAITVIYQSNNQPVNNKPNASTTGVIIDQVDKKATLHLIVVGINQYQNKKMVLNYALADATAFKDELEKDAKSVISNIKTYFITDNEANKAGFESALNAVKQNARAQDVFVFYYAGHGVIGKDKEFYLVPNDVSDLKNVQAELESKGIPARVLQKYAIDIAAQKQLFILDACQSAGAFNEMLSAGGDQQKSIAVVSRSTGTHWMAASGAQQFANEFSQLGHGAFTYVLLEALKGSAASNKMITVNGLKDYLQLGVPELMKKYSGTLQYPASYGFGNDFPVELIK